RETPGSAHQTPNEKNRFPSGLTSQAVLSSSRIENGGQPTPAWADDWALTKPNRVASIPTPSANANTATRHWPWMILVLENVHEKTPNPKHQTPEKSQAPNPKFRSGAVVLELEIWSFSGVWSLVFGVFNPV